METSGIRPFFKWIDPRGFGSRFGYVGWGLCQRSDGEEMEGAQVG